MMEAKPRVSEPPLSPEAVAAFLRAQPDFLAERPELYRVLSPPERVHGELLADHMAAMLRAERRHAEGVLAAGRAAAGLAARIQEAVLALIRTDHPAECITSELPPLLAVDAAGLCAEGDLAGARRLPAGTIGRLLGSQMAVVRERPTEGLLLHGEAAGLAIRDALIRVPGEGLPILLALVARDEAVLDPGQGLGALAFLGRAVAAALGR